MMFLFGYWLCSGLLTTAFMLVAACSLEGEKVIQRHYPQGLSPLGTLVLVLAGIAFSFTVGPFFPFIVIASQFSKKQ